MTQCSLKGASVYDNLKRISFKMINSISSWTLLFLASISVVVDASNLLIHESLTEDDCHQVYIKETVYNQDGYAIRPVVLKLVPDWLIELHRKPREEYSSCAAMNEDYPKMEQTNIYKRMTFFKAPSPFPARHAKRTTHVTKDNGNFSKITERGYQNCCQWKKNAN